MKSKIYILLISLLFSATIFAQETKTIYLMKDGKAIHKVAVSDIDSIIFYKSEFTQSDFVLINGVKWATRNVDAPGTFTVNPEDAGMFYQWNRSTGWAATGSVTGWDSSTPTCTTWETANNVCPVGYRVPTNTEIQSLVNSGSRWTTQNGVTGRVFGSGDNTIFLPAAGYRYFSSGSLINKGWNGYYWSSTQYASGSAYGLTFNSDDAYRFTGWDKAFGLSCRCVAE